MAWKRWLPYTVTLLLAALLVLTQQMWASPIVAQLTSTATASSKTTVNYQGYLLDSSGSPVNDTLEMVFRLYDTETGSPDTTLWTETQSVEVRDGLFSVLLGSVEPLSQLLFVQNDNLWLGITIGAEELTPREKLASAPYALAGGLPSGVIVMWSGPLSTIPEGWSLCDGTNGTPDLRDRFIVGAGTSYSVGNMGGAASVTLSINQIPPHSHSASTNSAGSHSHSANTNIAGGVEFSKSENHGRANRYGMATEFYYDNWTDGEHSHAVTINDAGSHSHSVTVNNTGEGQPHENRPPYYSLAFICKE